MVKKAGMLRNKAQSLTEYSICLAVVILAVVTMQVYVKRGLQARHKDAADYAWAKVKERVSADKLLTEKEKGEFLKDPQYEPYYQKQDLQSEPDIDIKTTTGESKPGTVTKTINKDSLRHYGEIRDLIRAE